MHNIMMAPVRKKPPTIAIEPLKRHAEVRLHGEVLASSWDALVLREGSLAPVVYYPRDDVKTHFLSASHLETRCPWKGVASHFSIAVAGASKQNAAWSYLDPLEPVSAIREHIAFYPEKVDFITLI